MRITELLEGKKFNDLDFIRKEGDKTELAFDLIEDLAYFLNNDDDIYRRYVYPAVNKCVESIKRNKTVSSSVFKTAVGEGYKEYIRKFPLKELADTLEDTLCKKVCDKMHEDVCKDVTEGKYKD
jgi:hypothetical protein